MARNDVYDAIVVGDGIAAKRFLYELTMNDECKKWNILQLRSEEAFPACSLKTTAVVCLSGIEKGISDLGDKLVDSYYEFTKFVETFSPKGIVKAKQILLSSGEDDQNFFKRYKENRLVGEGILSSTQLGAELDNYIIDAPVFLSWLDKNTTLNITRRNEMVTSFTESNNVCEVETNSIRYVSKRLFLFTSSYTPLSFSSLLSQKEVVKSKVVPGNYLEYKDIDLGEESFVLSKKHANLIYRANNHTLQLGGTTNKDSLSAINFEELKSIRDSFSNLIKIPSISDGEVLTGLRHKGVKRCPYWGKLGEGERIFGMFSLYKNGWTFPFLGAKELLQTILKP